MKSIPITQPFLDTKEEKAVLEVLRSGWLVQGTQVSEFENEISKHECVNFCSATSSCTTALQLAMESSGLGRGMDAFVPAFTFVATANAVAATGATPVLIDVYDTTFNISVEDIERKIDLIYCKKNNQLVNQETGNVLWGIVPVHQFGLCANMHRVAEIASKYSLRIVEDAACALGAKIENSHIGTYGDAACVSFHPRKSITTGEGGMVLTNSEDISKKVNALRNHGSEINSSDRHKQKGFLLPDFQYAGYNYRMTDIQGAIGKEQAKKLDYILKERRKKASHYDDLLNAMIPELITPAVPSGYFHTYQSYVCLLNLKKMNCSDIEKGKIFRNKILGELELRGVATRQGTHAISLLKYYIERFGYKKEDFPNAYRCDALSMSLPLYVTMGQDEQDYVVETIRTVIDLLLEKEM